MKMLRNNVYLSLVLLLPLVLTGCKWAKKTEVEEGSGCKSKKSALHDKSHGLPVFEDEKKASRKRRHKPKDIEAFVVQDHEDELLVSPTLVASDETISHSDLNWALEQNTEKEFEPVLFAFDSAEIREQEAPKLAYDVAHAQDAIRKGCTIVVEGHSDSEYRSAEHNIAMSEQRANIGKSELIKSGVPAEKIKVVAYGDNKKAVNTRKREERNRRLEFVAVSHDQNA